MIKNTLPQTELSPADFYYNLPEEAIAQTPLEPRDSSKLMILSRKTDTLTHKTFRDIIDYLNPGDVLVINDTRVIPARIFGKRVYNAAAFRSGGSSAVPPESASVELLLLKETEHDVWETLAGPGKRAMPGDKLSFGDGILTADIENIIDGGRRTVKFSVNKNSFATVYDALHSLGTMPLPPYIKTRLEDNERYQTVYSREEGSAAAPTAGLHFTDELLSKIKAKGVSIAPVLLHVGLGTFRPVKSENLQEHNMHTEFIQITQESADIINGCKKRGGRLIAVGTTSCRVIESASDEDGTVHPICDETGIFIYPGYKFKAVDGLITNFHLPESSLIMLVSAFYSREKILEAYNTAVKENYRFFSFGDAMFIV